MTIPIVTPHAGQIGGRSSTLGRRRVMRSAYAVALMRRRRGETWKTDGGPMSSRGHSLKGALATVAVLGVAGVAALALGRREAHPTVTPAQLLTAHLGGTVQLVGFVAGAPRFDNALEFVLTDQARTARVRVHYSGATGALHPGERVSVTGTYRSHLFLAQPDTLIAGCATAGSPEHC
jgi:hypothetical protein